MCVAHSFSSEVAYRQHICMHRRHRLGSPILDLSFIISLTPADIHTHTHAYTHTRKHTHIITSQNRYHEVDFLIALVTLIPFPLSWFLFSCLFTYPTSGLTVQTAKLAHLRAILHSLSCYGATSKYHWEEFHGVCTHFAT